MKNKINSSRPIHPDFFSLLTFKEQNLMDLFCDLRTYLLDLYPDSNELVYHTHALTSVFSISEKLSDAYCMIPVYTNHLNLGFNKGTLLKDPHHLLQGTGNFIRHIPVRKKEDYRNAEVKTLIEDAIRFSLNDLEKPTKSIGKTISHMKKK